MDIAYKEWTRPASSGEGEIFSRSWIGPQPKAVIELVHGMAEHSGRYGHFARFLAGNGFAVYANDHAGHGMSARQQGYFAARSGWECVVKDLDALMDEAAQAHPGLPLLLMGHSMGSFLSRSYMARYGEKLAGCVLCGTMGRNPAIKTGKALAALQCKTKGPRSIGKMLDKISTDVYNKRIKNPVNTAAWLSTDDQVCIDFAADAMCGFPFTAQGYYDLFTGLTEVTAPQWAGRVPKGLPVFLVAGEEDPVGSYGAGPRQVAEDLRAAGVQQVDCKIYPGMRHEILNEIGKEQVYSDVLGWLQGVLAAGQRDA